MPDDAWVAMGTGLEAAIPFAAGHEIIRQQKRNLTLIGPISDILFDQLIGAGCVARVRAPGSGMFRPGWVTTTAGRLSRVCPRRSKWTTIPNFTLALALQAGAQGLPYVATRSIEGGDILEKSRVFLKAASPFDGLPVALIPALRPDVTILHVQRSDEEGNAHLWGNLGVSEEAALAAHRVIITAEEIVPHKVITSDPNRVIAPGFKVAAVVHQPGGCHPSPLPGFYNRDHQFFTDYHQASRQPGKFSKLVAGMDFRPARPCCLPGKAG